MSCIRHTLEFFFTRSILTRYITPHVCAFCRVCSNAIHFFSKWKFNSMHRPKSMQKFNKTIKMSIISRFPQFVLPTHAAYQIFRECYRITIAAVFRSRLYTNWRRYFFNKIKIDCHSIEWMPFIMLFFSRSNSMRTLHATFTDNLFNVCMSRYTVHCCNTNASPVNVLDVCAPHEPHIVYGAKNNRRS